MTLTDIYLMTLRDALTGSLYDDWRHIHPWFGRLFRWLGLRITRPVTEHDRHNGQIWPETALTMVGTKRLDNIRECLQACDREGVPGAFVECGIWRGGACIYAAGVIASSGSNREVFACDSFRGLPKPSTEPDRQEALHLWRDADVLGVSQQEVWRNFCRFHLGTENVHLVEGWFSQTLKNLPCSQIAVLRADGDMYESTSQILELYPRVSSGGYVIIDDYGDIAGCKLATDEFLGRNPGLRIKQIDRSAIYWRKP